MRQAVNARFYTHDSVIGSWLTRGLIDLAFLAPLADDGVLANCRYISLNLKPAQPIGSVAQLRAQSNTWHYELVDLRSAEDYMDSDCEVILNINTNMVNVAVHLGGSLLTRLDGQLILLATRWVRRRSRKLPDTVELCDGFIRSRGRGAR